MKRRGFALGAAFAVSCLLGVGSGLISPAVAGLSATASQPGGSAAWQLAQVKPGDTIEAILVAAGASPSDAGLVAKALRTVFNPRDLKPGQQIAISLDTETSGQRVIHAASIELGKGRFIHIIRHEAGGFAARQATQPLDLISVGQALPALTLPSRNLAAQAPAIQPPAEAKSAPEASPAKPVQPVANAAEPKAESLPKGRTFQIKKGDTLASLLRATRIDGSEGSRALEALGNQINVGALSIGQDVIIARGSATKHGHELTRLAVVMKDGRLAQVVRRDDGSFAAPGSAAPSAAGAAVVPAVEPEVTAQARLAPAEKSSQADLDNAKAESASPTQAIAPLPPARPAREELEQAKAEPAITASATPAPAKKSTHTDASKTAQEVVELSKGGTLHSVLKTRGYTLDDIVSVAKATALSVDPTALRWGQKIRLGYRVEAHGKKRLDSLAIERKGQPSLLIARRIDGDFGPRTADGEKTVPIEPVVANVGADHAPAIDAVDTANADNSALYVEEQAAPRDAAYRILVQPGDSLMNMLLREGIDANEIDLAVRSLRKIYNPRRLREGQTVALLTDTDPSGGLHLSALSIALTDQRHVEARRSGEVFNSGFRRTPSFVDRLPPEGADVQIYAGYPALPQIGLAQAAMMSQARAASDEDGDETEGWSVLSWLGGIGNLIGRTSSAEAAVIDLAPEPKPNRVLDLDEPAQPLVEDTQIRKVEIAKGDTLVSALSKGGVSNAEAEAIAAAFKKVHSPRRLQAGQTMALAFDAIQVPSSEAKEPDANKSNTGPFLRRVSLSVGPDRDIVVERGDDDRFNAREFERPLVRTVYKATGKITSSFYESGLQIGLSIDVLSQMVQLFSYDVDFQRGLQRGDRFEVLFERTENDRGEIVEQGDVLYAALTLSGEELAFYRYETPDGPADYFDRAGNSVRKALLRTPVDGARISSGFGVRKHPILGYSKKHKGVDFAAPSGTPIYAAGDGVIEKIGSFSSYGKYIRIRHGDTFKTAYAHLKGYARGLKIGTRVRQGQVIGYVGSTGRSTGPHLHYEVMKRDVQVNPNDTKLPVGSKLGGKQLARFKTEIEGYKMMFAQASNLGTRVARNTRNDN